MTQYKHANVVLSNNSKRFLISTKNSRHGVDNNFHKCANSVNAGNISRISRLHPVELTVRPIDLEDPNDPNFMYTATIKVF